MPFYKIDRVMQYTESVYVEAADLIQAKEQAKHEDGYENHDYICADIIGKEIDKEEYESEV